MIKQDVLNQLKEALSQWPIVLTEKQCQQLVDYLLLLNKWNKVYNLTSIRQIKQMLVLHVLDSLSVVPYFQKYSLPYSILDVGSGGGLPGIVLAICFPEASITSIDIVQKKTAFQRQVQLELSLKNFQVVTERVEQFGVQQDSIFFDFIISRAFADLSKYFSLVNHLVVKEKGRILAMKAIINQKELNQVQSHLIDVMPLYVPFLKAERHLIEMKA